MTRRLVVAMATAASWSLPAALWLHLALGWILVVAAVIGILATIGCEPPTRRVRRIWSVPQVSRPC